MKLPESDLGQNFWVQWWPKISILKMHFESSFIFVLNSKKWKWRKGHFRKWAFSSLSETALPVPETKIYDHFLTQIFPQSMGKIVSETNFGHSKVVFSPPYCEREKNAFFKTFSNALILIFRILNLFQAFMFKICRPASCLEFLSDPSPLIGNACH